MARGICVWAPGHIVVQATKSCSCGYDPLSTEPTLTVFQREQRLREHRQEQQQLSQQPSTTTGEPVGDSPPSISETPDFAEAVSPGTDENEPRCQAQFIITGVQCQLPPHPVSTRHKSQDAKWSIEWRDGFGT